MPSALRPFRPSEHGMPFANAATDRLAVKVGPIPLGRVTGGLCGGMCLTALRAWRRGRPRPGVDSRTMTAVFANQLRSFEPTRAPLLYLRLQRPGAQRLRQRVTNAARERIAAGLRAGEPVPIALISSVTGDLRRLSDHHIVLGYELIAHDPIGTLIAIYDPNHPDADDVTLTLTARGRHRHSRGRSVHAAFALRVR